MPKSSVAPSATSVLDIIPIRTVGGLPMLGIGPITNPVAGPTLTPQTTGGTINTTTNASVDVAFSYTSTPGVGANATGETMVSPTVTVTMGAGLTVASILCVFPTTWPYAGAINVYVGAHGGTLFLMTGSVYPVPYQTAAVQIGSVPTSGTAIPSTNTSWSHGFTCSVVHDNDSAATALSPYVAAADTWTGPVTTALGWFEIGGGLYQVSEPNSAWSKAGAGIATFTISGVLGMGATTWTTALSSGSGALSAGAITLATFDANTLATIGRTYSISTGSGSPSAAFGDTWLPAAIDPTTHLVYYKGTASGLFLWFNGTNWIISALDETAGTNFWLGTPTMAGAYAPQGSNTGTLTMAVIGALPAVDASGRIQVQAGTATGQINITAGNLAGPVPSVTGAVGSVTGNVGGNVVGSTASVTGAVGSVTANVTIGGYASGQSPAVLVLDATASGHATAGTIGADIIAGAAGGGGGGGTVTGYATGQDPVTLMAAAGYTSSLATALGTNNTNTAAIKAAIAQSQINGLVTAASQTSLTVGTLTCNGVSVTPPTGNLAGMMCEVLDSSGNVKARLAITADSGTTARTLTFAAPGFAVAPLTSDTVAIS